MLLDDSDHYYETLNQNEHRDDGNIVVRAKLPTHGLVNEMNHNGGDHSQTSQANGAVEIHEDDYDSFDSDDDDDDGNVKRVSLSLRCAHFVVCIN